MNKFRSTRTVAKAVTVSLITTVCLTALVGSASAAKRGSTTSSAPTLSAPSSAPSGESFRVSGSGYDPTKQTWILVETASSRGYILASVDSAGNMSLDMSVAEIGNAKLTAQQTSGSRTTSMGNATVSIY